MPTSENKNGILEKRENNSFSENQIRRNPYERKAKHKSKPKNAWQQLQISAFIYNEENNFFHHAQISCYRRSGSRHRRMSLCPRRESPARQQPIPSYPDW